MNPVDRQNARSYVAAITPDTFRQKYSQIVASQEFGDLVSCKCTQGELNKVSSDLRTAGVPGKFLNEDAKVADFAGHLYQLYLCYSHRCY